MTSEELRTVVMTLPPDASITLGVSALREAMNDPEPNRACPPKPDRLLTAAQAAERLGVSTRYLYARRQAFPFTRSLPGNAVRFSEQGIDRWLARKN